MPQANPFTPNRPIDPEYFAGRIEEVRKVLKALTQTRHSKTQQILLTGERGIGKTSLAHYARYLASDPNPTLKTDFQFAVAYYTVERNQTLADVCRGLTSKLLDGIDKTLATRCVDRLKTLRLHFHVDIPGVGEIGVADAAPKVSQAQLTADFIMVLEKSWDDIHETKNGILLVIDELHNLARFDGVGSFFKVVSEGLAVDGYGQIMFMVIGSREISDKISDDDRSAARIFSYVDLPRMTTIESRMIIDKCLSDSEKTITEDAANLIADRSGGIPYFLHQLGYDVFEVDTDNIIEDTDASKGLIASLIQFERMTFGKLYKSVEGKQKQKIVDQLALGINVPQSAKQLEKSTRIKSNIHQYLGSLQKDGIVEKSEGNYRLTSDLLSIYVSLFKMIPRNATNSLSSLKLAEAEDSSAHEKAAASEDVDSK
jgi:hypothetical protein